MPCSSDINHWQAITLVIVSSLAGEGRIMMAFYIAMSGFIAANLTVIGAEVRNMRRMGSARRG